MSYGVILSPEETAFFAQCRKNAEEHPERIAPTVNPKLRQLRYGIVAENAAARGAVDQALKAWGQLAGEQGIGGKSGGKPGEPAGPALEPVTGITRKIVRPDPDAAAKWKEKQALPIKGDDE